MSTPIITIENVGKRYRLRHQAERQRYTALRDVIAGGAKRLFRGRPKRTDHQIQRSEEFWALKDVSLEIKHGEVVGIIGRNGAGKSTLLKILSRITEPTTGRIRIRGRVASLLEVGTGFHPELTGHENIYLNGAVLGMSRTEIHRKFDEIVAFADVERFLDTPVKQYSSGMYVRLAFAVAAYLEPEILVVDEVLAVGDLEFQKKCLGKMEHVSRESGRTVLFVSHNMAAVQALCSKTIVLDLGAVKFFGSSVEATRVYLAKEDNRTPIRRTPRLDGTPTITHLELISAECTHETYLHFNMRIEGAGVKRCCIEVKIRDQMGVPIGFASTGLLDPVNALDIRPGAEDFSCIVRMPRIARGTYRLSAQLGIPMVTTLDSTGEGICFEVHPMPLSGYERVLEAQWGYGAFELPLDIERTRINMSSSSKPGHVVGSVI